MATVVQMKVRSSETYPPSKPRDAKLSIDPTSSAKFRLPPAAAHVEP